MNAPRRAELGDVAEVKGRLARVISVNEGNRSIGFEFIGSEPCPTCGKPDRIDINEGCLNWREWVRPVATVPQPEPNSAQASIIAAAAFLPSDPDS